MRAVESNAAGHLAAERLPVLPRGAEELREGEELNEWFGAVWLPQPGRITWKNLAPVPGTYRIEFELRHSETGPEGTDQTGAYRVEVDRVEQSLEWVELNTANTGNAYFGKAQTPPIDLSDRAHTIRITTTQPWCAVRRGFRLWRSSPL